MTALLAMLPAFALGWTIVRLLAPHRRGFFSWMLQVSLGAGIGAGVSSLLDFLFTWAGIANRTSLLGVETLLLAATGFVVMRRRDDTPPNEPAKNPSWIWVLHIAAVLAVMLLVGDFANSTSSNPTGEWDASGIWNLRARFLAGGAAAWHEAFTIHANHPGYPLLVSGFIARTWTILGDTSPDVPAALSLIFTVATAGVLCGALALVSETLGWLAMLVLLATETFVSQSAAQYADIPLSFFVLAFAALFAWAASRDWPPGLLALAGLCVGFAAWTKNEGLPFAIAAFLVTLWRAKFASRWVVAGMAIPFLAALALKLFLVQGTESMFPKSAAQALKMIADPARWSKIIASFAHNIWTLGPPWAQPILLLAILGFALGFVPRDKWNTWLFAAPLALLAADFGIYLITMADLDWHLSTSNNRLLVQVWPALLFGYFAMLRVPVPEEVPAARVKSKKKARA